LYLCFFYWILDVAGNVVTIYTIVGVDTLIIFAFLLDFGRCRQRCYNLHDLALIRLLSLLFYWILDVAGNVVTIYTIVGVDTLVIFAFFTGFWTLQATLLRARQRIHITMNAIIIGASSGIGMELARLLAADGYTTYITGRREDRLLALQTENPERFRVKVFDITDLAASDRAFDEMVADLGMVDLVVVNSGWGDINKKLDWGLEHTVIQTNVVGATNMCVRAMHVFYGQNSGHLVGISSIAGLLGGRLNPAYNASKAFLSNYLHGLQLAVKSRKQPITVTDIRPGFVRTDLVKGDKVFWMQPVGKAARQILAAIKSKKKKAYITRRWALFGWLTKHVSGWT
jgi:short-subunit dehydrogenase